MEPKEEEGEREKGREATRSRNKQASRQCAVGGTRLWKHVVPFFLAFFSPLFHARFSARFFFFVPSAIPLAYLFSRSFQNSHPFRLLFFGFSFFLACSECAFGKFRDRCASPRPSSFQVTQRNEMRKIRYMLHLDR